MTAETTEATPRHQRRERGSVGGLTLKLDAPQRPGYRRRWVTMDPIRIAQMNRLGYDFVEEKAGDGVSRTDGEGTRITRYGGTNKKGEPVQLALMETPDEEYAAGVADKEQHAKRFEEAIARGPDAAGNLDPAHPARELQNAYQPAERTSIKHQR